MASEPARVTVAKGVDMPFVSFGTAFGNWTESGEGVYQGFLPEQANRAVTHALEAKYTGFDTAHAYCTEHILGRLLANKFADGSLSRDDVFLTTKVAHPLAPPHVSIPRRNCLDFRAPELKAAVQEQFEVSLERLGVGRVDLLLMHWPGSFEEKDGVFARRARLEVWEAMLGQHRKGAAKALGVCNFSVRHLTQLAEDSGALPAVNQIEVHPYCQPRELLAFCKGEGIVVEAYAPFASGAFGLLKDPVLVGIADEVGKSVGQVVLRWHVQHGRVVLPKSSNPVRMAQNLNLWSFSLTESQMAAIDALGDGEPRRTCPDPDSVL